MTIFLLGHTLWHVVTTVSNVPYRDGWEFVRQLAEIEAGRPLLSTLWHAEWSHRLLFPKLLFFLDAKWFALTTAPLIALILITHTFHLCLLSHSALKIFRELNPPLIKVLLVAALVSLLFSSLQMENFVWGFQLNFVLVYAMSAAAFFFLTFASHSDEIENVFDHRRPFVVLAVTCALVASYSMANGIFVWPILILEAAILRLGRAVIVSVAGAGTLAIAVFLWDYTPLVSGMGVQSATTDPLSTLWLIAMFLGGPINQKWIDPAAAVGGMGLLYAVWLIKEVLRRDRQDSPLLVFHASAVVFLILTAASVVVGRLSMDFVMGLEQHGMRPVPSRYLTVALLFWANLIPLAVYHLWMAKIHRAPILVFGLIILAMGPGTITWQIKNSKEFKSFFRYNDAVGSALLVGVTDQSALERIHPLGNRPGAGRDHYLADLSDYLQKERLAFFAEERADWVGKSKAAAFGEVKNDCKGRVESVESLSQNERKLTGWVWNPFERRVPLDLVIADCRGIVVGLARTGIRRPDVKRVVSEVSHGDPGWIGYAKINTASDCALRVFAVRSGDENSLCAVPGP